MRHAHPVLGTLAVLAAVPFALVVLPADSRTAAEEPGGATAWKLVTRTYRVEDLFQTDADPPPVHPMDALFPATGDAAAIRLDPHGFGDDARWDEWSMSPQAFMDLLKRVINTQSDPHVAAWADEGGPAACEYWSQRTAWTMIVTQTPEGHAGIESLLADLRRHSPYAGPMLTVRARWLAIEEARIPRLLAGGAGGRHPLVLDAEALEQASARTAFRAATTTFDRMNVTLSSGTWQNYVAGVERLSLGQGDWTKPERGNVFTGGFLTLLPRLSEDGSSALIDYVAYLNLATSTESRPGPNDEKAARTRDAPDEGTARVRIGSQRLHGSMKIPLEKTVLLGLTTGPDLKAGIVYALVVEVLARK